jgi:hypothetical protein
MVLEQILKQCGDDLSRRHHQAGKIAAEPGAAEALPGVRINTNASNNMIWTQLQLRRWAGTRWERFGEILDAGSE